MHQPCLDKNIANLTEKGGPRSMIQRYKGWRYENKKEVRELFDRATKNLHAIEDAQKSLTTAKSGLKTAAGKEAFERIQKATRKALGKIMGKLVPGLNIISTVFDVGEVVVIVGKLLTGYAKATFEGGSGGEGSGGSGGGEGGEGTSKTAGTGEGGKGGEGGEGGDGASEGKGAEGDSDAAGKMPELHEGAQAVLDILQSTGNMGQWYSADDVKNLNSAVPKGVTTKELDTLRKRLSRAEGGTPVANPNDTFEVVGRVHEELREMRSGGKVKAKVDGVDYTKELDKALLAEKERESAGPEGKSKEGSAKGKKESSEPPSQRLVPVDPASWLQYNAPEEEVALRPGILESVSAGELKHKDGLSVLVSEMQVDNQKRAANIDGKEETRILTRLTVLVTVVGLPEGAGADYPYALGDQRTEFYDYWYNPSTQTSGGVAPGLYDPLLSAIRPNGDRYELNPKKKRVDLKIAKVKVNEIVSQSSTPLENGTEHKIVLKIKPVSVAHKDAGILTESGWEKLVVGQPLDVPLTFHREMVREQG